MLVKIYIMATVYVFDVHISSVIGVIDPEAVIAFPVEQLA
jgi:hypothetical protein